MIVVDVLLGLNLLLLCACALRGRTSRGSKVLPVEATYDPAAMGADGVPGVPGGAVIIPFPSASRPRGMGRAMGLHPSAHAGPSHKL